jgi:uncharacterized protein (TIGR03067 family)
MKLLLVFSVGLFAVDFLSAGQTQPPDEAAKKDLKLLQGTWNVVSAEMSGKKVTGSDILIEQIIFNGDKMTFKAKGKEILTIGISLDPSKKPKALDWVNFLQDKTQPLRSIYAIENDELRLCFPLLPRKGAKAEDLPKGFLDRPTNFETEGKLVGLVVAKRAKP